MTFYWNRKIRPAMRLAHGMIALSLALAACAYAQNEAKPASETVETFYLANISQQEDGYQIRNALQSVLPSASTVQFSSLQNALIVRAAPEQILIAQKIIAALDHPKKTYRLSYTITETDAGKRIGTQHYALIIVSGQRTALKQGSKVPVATGSYDSGKAGTQTQFTYLDVGINIDSTLDDSSNGVRLKSKVEQSSIADSTAIAQVQEPIIRQSVLESTSLLTLGKPLILGGLDITGSTRHLDIEAVVELIKEH